MGENTWVFTLKPERSDVIFAYVYKQMLRCAAFGVNTRLELRGTNNN